MIWSTNIAFAATALVAPVYPAGGSLRVALGDHAFQPSISSDGRLVVFQTRLGIDPTDNNNIDDVYLLDRYTRHYTLISRTGAAAGNGPSLRPAISADGRFVVFHSVANNLTTSDFNDHVDIFIHDRVTAVTELVSIATSAIQANDNSFNASVSGDGRFVAFASLANNLVVSDSNDHSDIFVRDRQRQQTMRVSVDSNGNEGDLGSFLPSLSLNGRYVAFESDATNFSDNEFDQLVDLFVHDTATGATTLVNVSSSGTRANGQSKRPVISADGRYVTFYSQATTFFPEFEDLQFDIFVHDGLSLRTELISTPRDGEPVDASSFNPSMSFDNRYVAYQSSASNLTVPAANGLSNIFLYDRQMRITQLISMRSPMAASNAGSFTPSLSGDGSTLLFETLATNLDAVLANRLALFAHDLGTADLDRLTLIDDANLPLNATVFAPQIVGNGRYTIFASSDNNLIVGDQNGYQDIFLYDRLNTSIRLVSGDSNGQIIHGPEGGASRHPSVADDGCRIVFESESDGDALGNGSVVIDANASADVYLRDLCSGYTLRVLSLAAGGFEHADGPSHQAQISADGQRVAFASMASNLIPTSVGNGRLQVYLYDLQTDVIRLISTDGTGTAAAFDSDQPTLSASGRYIAFVSRDPGLDPTVPTNQRPSAGDAAVYRVDTQTGIMQLVSRGIDGAGNLTAPLGMSERPTISADGKVIAFDSSAPNLTPQASNGIRQIYVWREAGMEANRIVALNPPGATANGISERPDVSWDGRVVVFQSDASNWVGDDSNGNTDIIAVDLIDGGVSLVSRTDDGSIAPGGTSAEPSVSRHGHDLDIAYTSTAAISGNSTAGLYIQPLHVSRPSLVIEGFVDSPLQTIERGAMRLQIRNDGNVPIRATDGLTIRFPTVQHAVEIGVHPRWQCQTITMPLSCNFVGDPRLGDSIPPNAAERIDFDFDMAPGDQSIVSQVLASAEFLGDDEVPSITLETARVQLGVVWQSDAPLELRAGTVDVVTVTITNGGLQAVSEIIVSLAPLIEGTPRHSVVAGSYGDWQCMNESDPDSGFELTCRLTQSPLAIGATTQLTLPFAMGSAPRRVSLLQIAAAVDVVSPSLLQRIETTVPGLIFANGFEG